jgi:hypothetical protein
MIMVVDLLPVQKKGLEELQSLANQTEFKDLS